MCVCVCVCVCFDECSIFTDDCRLLDSDKRRKKQHLYIERLKYQTLVQHEYLSLNEFDYTPVISQGKITSNHKRRRI